jgi:hypothetical protein
MRTGLLESPVLLVAGGGAAGAGLRWAVLGALPDGDPGGDATTHQFTEAVLSAL